MTYFALTKVFLLITFAFLTALLLTPFWSAVLYKFKLGKSIRNDGSTPLFSQLHAAKAGVPTMGGVLVWGTVAILVSIFWFLDRILHVQEFHVVNFLTRKETLLPLGAFIGASLVGLADDFLDIRQMGYKGRGIRFRHKVLLYALVALVGAVWFYFKLGVSAVNIPFLGVENLGIWFIPFFVLAVVGIGFAVNETDGLDGLAGGTLLISFFSFGLIAYLQHSYNLAGFIGAVCGALLAFLWFNIFPARFIMGDTGSMGLGVLLALVAFLTNSVFLLAFFGFIFMVEAFSVFLQLLWRKVFKRKLLLSAPLHHHFEALGWPETKVTMRFWIIAMVMSILGLVVYFVS